MRVPEPFQAFFDTAALSPHGICLLWRPELIWTHALSDTFIGLAYLSIPLALGTFLYRRRDFRFGWAVWLFVCFIMLCGATHFMMVWTLWRPDYGIEALLKATTAAASVVTAIALWPLLPRVIAIPSSATMQARIDERDQALWELRAAMTTMMEMREHEARQKLLLDELNHRVKNTLTTVQSISAQTLANAENLEAFRDAFEDRLIALSAAHNLLVNAEWRSASFRELVRVTLDHQGHPYELEGPDLLLHPNYAVSLSLGLNELATNSLKYGAWSGHGEVRIRVDVLGASNDQQVKLTWSEVGGPEVVPPTRQGLGSRLIERGIAAELRAKVSLDYRPQGLVCMLVAPISDRLRPLSDGASTQSGAEEKA